MEDYEFDDMEYRYFSSYSDNHKKLTATVEKTLSSIKQYIIVHLSAKFAIKEISTGDNFTRFKFFNHDILVTFEINVENNFGIMEWHNVNQDFFRPDKANANLIFKKKFNDSGQVLDVPNGAPRHDEMIWQRKSILDYLDDFCKEVNKIDPLL